MFTGIVTDIGELTAVTPGGQKGDRKFVIRTKHDLAPVPMGASIACSGCCLTVVEKGADWFAVEASELTFAYDGHPALDGLSLSIPAGALCGLLGPNGSGKSTFLQILAGAIFHNEGSVNYTNQQGNIIAEEDIFKSVSFCAPYLELIEEMTAAEQIHFHKKFKDCEKRDEKKTQVKKLKNNN